MQRGGAAAAMPVEFAPAPEVLTFVDGFVAMAAVASWRWLRGHGLVAGCVTMASWPRLRGHGFVAMASWPWLPSHGFVAGFVAMAPWP